MKIKYLQSKNFMDTKERKKEIIDEFKKKIRSTNIT